jgi:hypothetical protein
VPAIPSSRPFVKEMTDSLHEAFTGENRDFLS